MNPDPIAYGPPGYHHTSSSAEPAGFFQPGRTYAHLRWTFRCDTVTTHPHTGERAALGWCRGPGMRWRPHYCIQWEWDEDTWTDTTATVTVPSTYDPEAGR